MEPQFGPRRSSHAPPETLSDDALSASLARLRRKLHAARRLLFVAHVTGATMTFFVIGAGFAVFWAGPSQFFERFMGPEYPVTVLDVAAWWLVLVGLAVVGGAFGVQLLRGKLRLVRRRRHRVHELARRIVEAEAEQQRRTAAG